MVKVIKLRFSSHLILSLSLTLLNLFPNLEAIADLPDAPVILDFGPAGCLPSAEICGDGIDQDCNGSDLFCPPPTGGPGDLDSDGYPSASDCDDTDRKVYPGIYVACSASCGSGTKVCQGNATFSGCSCSPLCEATGGGRCYYVSKLTGNDSNPGTFSQPLRTLQPLADDHPSQRFNIGAGDAVYLMSGVYDETYQAGVWRQVFQMNYANGTPTAKVLIKAYPGAHPVISSSSQGGGFTLLSVFNTVIEGIEFNQTYQYGIFLGDSANVEMRNLWVHDTDGEDNENIAGINVTKSADWSLHHSLLHDNYDRTAADTGGEKTENSRNMVIFRGGSSRVHHNVFFQTPPITAQRTGGCLVQKHSMDSPGALLEVDHNVFKNCWYNAIGTGSYGGRFHHNLIMDSTLAFNLKDHGDSQAQLANNIIEKNTIVRATGLQYLPSQILVWGYPLGQVAFRKNIVVDTISYNTDIGGIHAIDPYGSDSVYNTTMGSGDLQINQNCYFNTNFPVQFCLFCASSSGGGAFGGLFPLANWQQFFDQNSYVVDPQLDSNNIPQAPQCTGFGHAIP